jgi:hypothetical protein
MIEYIYHSIRSLEPLVGNEGDCGLGREIST